ncbi:MAG: hypothetical protein R3E87_19830 [Burkholderiaceae bacterium]
MTPLNAQGKGVVQLNLLGGPEVTPADRAPRMAAARRDRRAVHSGCLCGRPRAKPGPSDAANPGYREGALSGAADAYNKIFGERLKAHMLAWSETGPGSGYYLYTKKEPVIKDGVVDLTGLKMRTTGAYRPIQTALGATTVKFRRVMCPPAWSVA